MVTVLTTVALAAISGSAAAQQPAPAPAPPSGYAPPPPGYYAPPPPGYYAPPPGYYAPPPGAYAYPPPGYQAPPPAGSNEHDGFYLRLHFGIGYSRIRGVDSAGVEQVFDGESGTFGVAVGGMVVRNLGLYGTFVASFTDSPDYSVNGSSVGAVRGTASLFGFGGGVVYYLDPANVYFYGAIASVQFELTDSNDNTVDESKFGLGFQGGVGKEWWISPNWGIGVAAEVLGASMPDKNDASLTWRGGSLSLLFSSTYN